MDAALGYAEWGTSIGGIASQFLVPCFPAGTLVETEQGPVEIERLKAGGLVASRDEHDPAGAVEFKVIFTRQGEILHLHVAGEVIRTTPEHPFYVLNQGWTAAGELKPGDHLSTMSGAPVEVEEVFWTGEWW